MCVASCPFCVRVYAYSDAFFWVAFEWDFCKYSPFNLHAKTIIGITFETDMYTFIEMETKKRTNERRKEI